MSMEELKKQFGELPLWARVLCALIVVATPILVPVIPYVAAGTTGEEVEIVTPPPTGSAGWSQPINITRGDTVKLGDSGISVTLDDVDTLKGNADDEFDPNDGIAFNRKMPRAAHLMEAALNAAGVENVEALDVLSKSQADWEQFLKDIGDDKAEVIKEMPIAKLRLDADEDGKQRRAVVVMKDTMAVNSPLLGAVQIRVAEIANTKKASGVRESMRVEFRKMN